MMYFSMIKLRRDIPPREIVRLTRMNGYQVHQLVWQLFADHPNRQRDFIYRYELIRNQPSFYTVSSRSPMANPDLWEIHTKDYNPQLRAGQKLGFTLRVNPIRTRHDTNGKQQRHDVVMEEKFRLKKEGGDIDMPDIIQEHGWQWLDKRSASQGFIITPDAVKVDGYQQHKFFKGKGNKPITFSSLELNGVLTVSQPDLFIQNSLYNGIGPAKSFGCGLMLVRRIQES